MSASEIVQKYIKLIKNLLPQGFAWEQVRDDLTGLISGMAVEYCRIDERAQDLLTEFDPGTATEMIEDWESLLGLPDECSDLSNDLAIRRVQARQKLAAQGGLSANYLESVAADLGFNAIVTDYVQFRVGRQRVGDRLSNDFDFDFRVGRNRVGDRLAETGWKYVFEVNVEETSTEKFRVGINRVGEALSVFQNPLLECTIFKIKPAHTQPFFTFRSP